MIVLVGFALLAPSSTLSDSYGWGRAQSVQPLDHSHVPSARLIALSGVNRPGPADTMCRQGGSDDVDAVTTGCESWMLGKPNDLC